MDKEVAWWLHPKTCSQQLQGYVLRIMRKHCRIWAKVWSLIIGEAVFRLPDQYSFLLVCQYWGMSRIKNFLKLLVIPWDWTKPRSVCVLWILELCQHLKVYWIWRSHTEILLAIKFGSTKQIENEDFFQTVEEISKTEEAENSVLIPSCPPTTYLRCAKKSQSYCIFQIF